VIHYTLVCDGDHDFEGWFRSSDDFETQAARGLLACPVCGSTKVARALMAPAVRSERASPPAAGEAAGPAPAAAPPAPAETVPAPIAMAMANAAMADPRAAAMVAMLRQLRQHVEATAENVGKRFPEEARKIHFGETEARGIYGEASREEVEALLEEGVDVHPLPLLPEDRN